MDLAPPTVGSSARAEAAAGSVLSPVVWMCLLTGVAVVLRVIALGYKSFWLDEIASVFFGSLPTKLFWPWIWRTEGNMALYYVLLKPWLHFGLGEGRVRVLSVVFGAASVPMLYLVGSRLFGRKVGLIAAVLLVLNACAVGMSQEARGYSLLVLMVLVSTYAFIRLVEQPSLKMACIYGLATGLTFYCHYFGLLVPVAHGISLVALPRRRVPWKPLLVAAVIIATLAVPVLWMIHIQDVGHISWVPRPSWLELYRVASYLAAATGKLLGGTLLALELWLIALFVARLIKLWPARNSDLMCWRYSLPASGLIAPLIITLLVSIVRPVFYHRFLVIALPGWILAVAAGMSEIRNVKWRAFAIVSVCGLSVATTISGYMRVQEDWRGAVSYLIAEAHPDDRVLFYQADGYFATEAYRSWLPGGSAARPAGIAIHPSDEQWKLQMDNAPRVWLVLYRAKPDDAEAQSIESYLRNRYEPEQRRMLRGISIEEYRAKP